MKLLILSREKIKLFIPQDWCVVVSITSVDRDYAEIPNHYLILDVYRCKFRDSTDETLDDVISDLQALEIAQFIKKYYDLQIDTLICQCDAGISRSAGVAKAVCEWLGKDFKKEFDWDPLLQMYTYNYFPNSLVFKKVFRYLSQFDK